ATVSQAARPILTNSTHRAALAGGTGGATSNVLNYHTYHDGDRTAGGYAQSAVTGFGTGAGGSYASAALTPVSRSFGDSVTRSVAPSSRGAVTHLHNAGAPVGSFVGDGVAGSASSGVNVLLMPGETTPADYNTAVFNGFISGGSGPSVGMR